MLISEKGVTFQPDAILNTKDGTQVFVEFFKTHKTDLDKIEKIKTIGVNTIEIHLKHFEPLINNKINYEGIQNFLETDIIRHWLFHTDTSRLMEIEKERLLNETKVEEMNRHFWEREPSKEEKEETIREVRQRKSKKVEENKLLSGLSLPYLAKGFELIEVFFSPDSQTPEAQRKVTDQSTAPQRACILCPKIQESDRQINLDSCSPCVFHHTILFGRNPLAAVCGFKNNIEREQAG
jgi:hypothetical protein